jgi:hypothetical protein
MTHRKPLAAIACSGFVVAALASAATAAMPQAYKNCTTLNRPYPHGIGKDAARDHTAGEPVATFKRSNTLYRIAMQDNRGLDRDKDGIACEKL